MKTKADGMPFKVKSLEKSEQQYLQKAEVKKYLCPRSAKSVSE
mgnify:CR=1 FL=1